MAICMVLNIGLHHFTYINSVYTVQLNTFLWLKGGPYEEKKPTMHAYCIRIKRSGAQHLEALPDPELLVSKQTFRERLDALKRSTSVSDPHWFYADPDQFLK
jgi:hypothetical protein